MTTDNKATTVIRYLIKWLCATNERYSMRFCAWSVERSITDTPTVRMPLAIL